MMVRLNMPKHQKNAKKRGTMSMSGQLSGITHFGDITALTGGQGGQVSSIRSEFFNWAIFKPLRVLVYFKLLKEF